MQQSHDSKPGGGVAEGGMRDRIRAFDWAATPLGPRDRWPGSLKTVVDLMLSTPQMAMLAVGPERIFLYNDEAARHYGARHPAALGLPMAEAFPHEFHLAAPFYDRVFAGESIHVLAQPLDPAQTGTPDLFDACLIPVRTEEGGVIAAYVLGLTVGARHRTEADLERRIETATAELRASRDLLQGVINSSRDMIHVFEAIRDDAGEIVDFRWILNNDISASLYGETNGDTLLERNPGVVQAGIFDAFRRVTETGVPEQAEHHYVHEQFDGWFYQSVVRFGDGVATTTKAIDDLKRSQADLLRLREAAAEARLRESDARYRTLFETMDQGFCIIAKLDTAPGEPSDYRYLEANPAFLRLTGMPDPVGRTLRDLVPGIEEEIMDRYDRVLRTGRAERFEAYVSDLARWIDAEVSPAREAGQLAVLFSNVTARKQAEARLRESEERQTFLLKLSDALAPLGDPAEIQGEATRLLGRKLGLGWCYYVEFDEAGTAGIVLKDAPRPGLPSLVGDHDLSDVPEFISHLRSGQVMDAPEIATYPLFSRRMTEQYSALGMQSALAVPLVKDGRLIALLVAADTAPREWPASAVTLVRDVAERAWAALERPRAEALLRRSEEALATDLANAELLRGLAERLVTEENIKTIYDEMLSAALMVARADAGTVQLHDPETDSLALLTTRNFSLRVTDRFSSVESSSRTACGIALKTGRRVFVDLVDEVDDAGCRLLVDAGFRTALTIPLVSRAGDMLGMLNAHWHAAGHRPTEGQLRFLDLIARQTADLIEQRQAQDSQRQAEERLRQFGEASQDILWMRDSETLQWVYLTPAFEAIYGLGREEALTGDDYRRWQDLIVPEDLEHATGSIERVRAGEHLTFEYRIRRASDGTVRWLRDTDFPITDAAGKVVLIGGIGHDFTEVREAERRFQALVEGIPQLVWRAADPGAWTWASPQWTDYTGQQEAEYRDWGWLDAVHPDDRDDARGAWARATAQGGFEVEYRLGRHEDGEHRWFQTRAAPMRDPSGTIIEWLGTSTDIHDLRMLQERQKVLVAELQHRTRNLMGVVRSMADRTIRSSADLPAFRARFHTRLEALARVQALLSRLEANDRVTFDELIGTELAAMNGDADRVVLDGPPGIRLRSSTVQILAMALHELATNAVKYGALGQPSGRLAIRWRLERAAAGRPPWLHIDWRESGVTMPPPDALPAGTGQGRALIERALPYQLSARTSFTLRPDGVHCTIALPVSARTLEEQT